MLDLTKLQKKYYDVTLPNGVVININPPAKKVYERFFSMQNDIDTTVGLGMIDEIYDLISVIISNNKQQRKITVEEVEEMFDLSMIRQFLKSYMGFVNKVLSNPN